MQHKMRLAQIPFEAIRTGNKTIEMRLYDEKRSAINVGDEIEFENIDTRQIIKCAIVSLAHYKDFYDLYDNVDKAALGYAENETPNPADMFSYYSPEQIEKYGALAIEIKLL